MPHALQEKFQITTPVAHKDEADDKWVWPVDKAHESQDSVPQYNPSNPGRVHLKRLNRMPPGMGIENQTSIQIENIPLVMSGENDVSGDVNPASFKDGFKVIGMKGTDDQYTGEHVDHFYGEAVGDDGNVGFIERNNYLDRM